MAPWLTACRDHLTPDGSLWVLIGDEYAAEYGVLLKRLGLTIRSWIKWFESFGVNCCRNFNRCSRHLFYCLRNPQQFVFHEDAVTRPSDRQTKYADKRAALTGKLWDNVWGIEPAIPRLTGTCNERIPDFPTQLPLALLEPIIQCASDPGDLVLDPFSGSGTTRSRGDSPPATVSRDREIRQVRRPGPPSAARNRPCVKSHSSPVATVRQKGT